MGTASRSPYFHSHATEPMSTVLINPNGQPVSYLPVVADTANIYSGMLVDITASTYPNEVTELGAQQGKDHLDPHPLLIEIDPAHESLPLNYDKTTAHPNLAKMRALELFVGMDVWLKGSTLTCSQDETLVPAAAGLVTNMGDPDGEAIEQTAFAFRALTALTSGTWIPCRVLSRATFDDS